MYVNFLRPPHPGVVQTQLSMLLSWSEWNKWSAPLPRLLERRSRNARSWVFFMEDESSLWCPFGWIMGANIKHNSLFFTLLFVIMILHLDPWPGFLSLLADKKYLATSSVYLSVYFFIESALDWLYCAGHSCVTVLRKPCRTLFGTFPL